MIGLFLGEKDLPNEIIFNNYLFRKNIENISQELKENKFVNNIVKFINSDKKRPISVPSIDK